MSAIVDDYGSAFPCEGGPSSGLHANPGMTLRDWFAGKALTGLCQSDGSSPRDTAADAYLYADAMIAERERPRGVDDHAELVEALEEMQAAHQRVDPHSPESCSPCTQARAAIAKAKGGAR